MYEYSVRVRVYWAVRVSTVCVCACTWVSEYVWVHYVCARVRGCQSMYEYSMYTRVLWERGEVNILP